MSWSAPKTLLALAALVALLGLGACGGGDEQGSPGGTPAASGDGGAGASVTEQLFADPAAGKKGGKLTVLSAGDVD